MTAKKIVFQGEPGANSHLASREVYPDYEAVPCATFEDAFAAISAGEGALGMIPIENSVAGRVADIHHLLPDSGLHIVAEHFMPVRHQLLAPKGATLSDIKTVESHVHALGQCRRVIRKLGIKPVVAADTAGSAREVAEMGDKTRAAIASRTKTTTPRVSSCSRAMQNGPRATAARWLPRSCFGCATCPPRSTRRSAALPPTASI
jgi:prephenate dehydratase